MPDVIQKPGTADYDQLFVTVDAAAAQTNVFPLWPVRNDTGVTISDPAVTGVVGCKLYGTFAPAADVLAGAASVVWKEITSPAFSVSVPLVFLDCLYTGLKFEAAAAKGPFGYTVRSRRKDRVN